MYVCVHVCVCYCCNLCLCCVEGSDVTLIGYGAQIQTLRNVVHMVQTELGASCELIDLRTIQPWDSDTVLKVKVKLT